ncbi:MAG: DUF1177 domain-containing protein [Burkholderiaceae bacterium]
MAWQQALEVHERLSSPRASGEAIGQLLRERGAQDVTVTRVHGPSGETEFVRGRLRGAGRGPVLGLIGRLGGVGARPQAIGLVSDADGAVAVLAAALKLADMAVQGDVLPADVLFATHICPDAPVVPHYPVPLMNSPVGMAVMNAHEVDPEMDAILSVDTTRGNRVINTKGIAITPTVKEGWILRVSEPLLDRLSWVTGQMPSVLPITTQDITPYENALYHVNSIMQPATATRAPVVGVALTAQSTVPGCATGASQLMDIECAARFCIEVAKAFGAGQCPFHDPAEWVEIQRRYGSLAHLQLPQAVA